MLSRRGLLILLVGFVASAVGLAQTVSVQVSLSGIIGIGPPADGTSDPIRVLLVNATNAGSKQHLPYLQWDTTKTYVSNWQDAGWGCFSINGTNYVSCPFGSPGENFTLNFTSNGSVAQGSNFDCVVPIQQTLNNYFTPLSSGVLSKFEIPKGIYGGANIDSQLWSYANGVCLQPAETATVTVTADSTQPITLKSTLSGKDPLQLGRVTGSPGILLSVLNIRPSEINNLALGHSHTGGSPDNDYLLYQVLVPNGVGSLTAPTWTTAANCPHPTCTPTLEPAEVFATGGGAKTPSVADMLIWWHPNGSNCPPVRFKKGIVK